MSNLPEHAECSGCGYALKELPETVCPECSRAFDPEDPTTFRIGSDRARRRRLVKRLSIIGGVVLVVAALVPHRVLRGSATFSCPTCGEGAVVRRWQPVPPRWVPFDYPVAHWTTRTDGDPAPDACAAHVVSVSLQVQFNAGSGTAFGESSPGSDLVVNDIIATPESAPDVIESIVKNDGVWITERPRETD